MLYGCGDDAPCDDAVIQGVIPVPKRVMVEGITVPPLEYGVRRHDVACRGIADPSTGLGGIVTSPLNFPGLDDAVHAVVPLLRVGAFNGMFGSDNPVAPGMTTTLLVPQESREDIAGDLRVTTGGIVVAAGGYDYTNGNRPLLDVWEFHPWEIAWERVATTTTGHYFGGAESFVDGAGNPAVLFVGGYGTNGGAVLTSDVYRRGKAVTDPFLANAARPFAGVERIVEREEPVIAVLGGCHGTTYPRDFEYFHPIARPSGCPGVGSPGYCTPASSVMVEGRCQAGFEVLPGARIWFGTGMTDDGDISDDAYVFDASGIGDYGTLVASIQTPVRHPATSLLHDDIVGMFGGVLTPGPTLSAGVTDRWVALDPLTGSVAEGVLRKARGIATATKLLDGRVLVAGGIADGSVPMASVEIFERGNDESGGESEHLSRAGRTSCVDGQDCERMSQARFVHAATRITGTATWLEGAVLITGGSVVAGGTPEVFVPAYDCEGTRPVNRFDGRRVPDVELCDRLREPEKITDPRKPKRF